MSGRLKELARLGFKECVVTGSVKNADWLKGEPGLRLLPCRKISELQEAIF
jgi:hypothetical protein